MAERLLITGGSGFIGSHLIEAVARRDCALINLDVKPPSIPSQGGYWRQCDLKDIDCTAAAFREFQPTRVIHLAAKANLQGRTVEEFPDNTIGTANVVLCVNDTETVGLFVNTSTQYVVKPGILPPDAFYLEPYTAYGESKAVAERFVRTNCKRNWAIVRPTNIWGPLHPFFPNELWRYLASRYYVHPGFRPIYKHYGFVSNAVEQILSVALSQSSADVCGRVWYITDGPIDNADWMNEFSVRLTGKTIRRAPLWVWRFMASIGDALRLLGFKVPVDSDRLFRLTVGETLPKDMIVTTPGKAVSLQDGVRRSVAWYNSVRSES
jgi:GlcNAc-P-P-Und epimerase